ncbi:MAG: GTP 3',8-cyclase MoaA [Candidatus Thiodubiliella endoseptemdiera]|uniref:GTP 3',8-cyclase n=1 Tax=Candidatus Thiodubiliella endoseptemdiera TaxID=2738886 RepID=A0A853F406_9GAMM|nr:GTP 3',8-cyclase MoaA [Candidatus Thiodubiliella endoseptemdiera]
MTTLIDPFSRKINYLRISVTDHCNYRCFYCRDEFHNNRTTRSKVLSLEEIARIARLFSELGVSKVRLTGGEPLIRKNILSLVEMLGKIPNINDIPLSTNAHLLKQHAQELQHLGVNRVNISIDSLQEKRFSDITRGGDLSKVIKGIDAAIMAGMHPIKLNMVVMQDTNADEIEAMLDFAIDREIDIRFIETMPIGTSGIEASRQHISQADILARVEAHLKQDLQKIQLHDTDGPAHNYQIINSKSRVGVISAVSDNFCTTCNRVRLTAKGQLILCLGQENSVSLRDAIRAHKTDDEIKQIIINAIGKKPEKHEFNTNINNIELRQMVEIGG